jgi:FtsH-binding integral membrane protein
MNDSNQYAVPGSLIQRDDVTRGSFYRKTFLHLAGSLVIFGALCAAMIVTPLGAVIANLFFSSQLAVFLTLAAFIGASVMAQRWAYNSSSLANQYLGLGLYIIVQSVIFAPLLLVAEATAGVGLIGFAAVMTGVLAGGLVFLAAFNRVDFTFLNGFLFISFVVLAGLALGSAIFGLQLGMWFSAVMIGFASLAILRDVSAIKYHFQPNQYVAASLSLFASIALLFYYILRFFLQFTSRN